MQLPGPAEAGHYRRHHEELEGHEGPLSIRSLKRLRAHRAPCRSVFVLGEQQTASETLRHREVHPDNALSVPPWLCRSRSV
jgi:hypothetical protein